MSELGIPSDQEFLDEFGQEPQQAGEPWEKSISIPATNGELMISFNEIERSVQFEWRQDDDVVWHCVREHASRLSIRTEHEQTYIIAEFDIPTMTGNITIRLYPRIFIRDTVLRT